MGGTNDAVSDYTRAIVAGGSTNQAMFTGIVVDTGTVTGTSGPAARSFRIEPTRMPDGLRVGASIACAGICLTATTVDPAGFTVDVSPETRARTTAGTWQAGTRINLEYALQAGDALDGHIVTGHVDAVARILGVTASEDSRIVRIALPDAIAAMVAPKGSIAVDGTSLTVNAVDRDAFAVTLIPHTSCITTLGELISGASVNLEADILARYVARSLDRLGSGDAR